MMKSYKNKEKLQKKNETLKLKLFECDQNTKAEKNDD